MSEDTDHTECDAVLLLAKKTIEELVSKLKTAGKFEKALRNRHNAYDSNINCPEPKSPKIALDELLAEAELLGCSEREVVLKEQLETAEKEAKAGKRLYIDAQKRCKAQALRGDTLEAENKQLEEEDRWIPVGERLPENIADVWIILGNPLDTDVQLSGIGFYGKDENGYSWEIYGSGLLTHVTYWKPIVWPQVLKEQNDKRH